jgi:hypothetical protein
MTRSQNTKTAKAKNNKRAASREPKQSRVIKNQALPKRRAPFALPNEEPKMSRFARNFAVIAIIIASLSVIINAVATAIFSEDRVAESKIEELGRRYYEEYYYNKITSTIADKPTPAQISSALEKYEKSGFASVTLQQLLIINGREFADYARYFSNNRFACDPTGTTIKIIPVAPYGKSDYSVKTNLDCSWRREI